MPSARNKPDWKLLRSVLAIRANFQCEGCGLPFSPHPTYGFSVSHRMPRSSGIKDDWLHFTSNLALFCGQGSEKGTCHGRCKDEPALAIADGHAISRFDTRLPDTIPIRFHSGWYLLNDEGGKVRVQ